MKTINETVCSEQAPAAIGPYSQAVRAGEWVFVSGQLPVDAKSGKLEEGVAAQTERALKNVGAVLAAAGLDYRHVVKTTVFMTDLGRFAEMNDVYARFFKDAPPARATVQVSALPKGASVEIEAVARG
ncbi:MAG: RidA family protein [Elusimicrobiota bacterium]|jgi:2-iminobutanoate/2-iminopropanoate deaminase